MGMFGWERASLLKSIGSLTSEASGWRNDPQFVIQSALDGWNMDTGKFVLAFILSLI